MKCAHCLHYFHDDTNFDYLGHDVEGHWYIQKCSCAGCKKLIFQLVNAPLQMGGRPHWGAKEKKTGMLIRPFGTGRNPCPPEVPPDIASDYRESCLVLAISPKASAALSRRCLQNILRDAASLTDKSGNLSREIDEVIQRGNLPPQIAESIDSIRVTGNFAAHPMKSTNTGQIVDVEPEEAEWNLDVIESLFDFYYVQPALLQAKKAAMNAKLASAGKQPMK